MTVATEKYNVLQLWQDGFPARLAADLEVLLAWMVKLERR